MKTNITMITRKELIKKYLEFFKAKEHKTIPNVSLVPNDDPTTLFISAGMQSLIPYLLGQKHPLGKRLVNVQKCIRTTDIEEVGDKSHHTFFEMLGNWSLGDYWKKDAIGYSFDFLAKELKIPEEKISVTCFVGENNIPKDIESADIWKSLSIKKIKFLGKKDNWWGPIGNTGPCGPDTEIFIDNIEIWNDVFMQYNKTEKGKYKPLKQKNVDTGMGVERTIAILNGFEDNYLTEIWQPIIKEIEKISGKKYKGNERTMRIIADHIKSAVFILAEGIAPSNTEQGYILRRLIRRAVRYGRELRIKNFTKQIAEPVFEIYDNYKELKKNKKKIFKELEQEEEKFKLTLEKGLNKFNKMIKGKKELSGKDIFLMYQSYGFPIELIEEEAKNRKLKIDLKDFEKEQKKHQKLSRTATKGKFTAGLADHSEKTTKYHTATHLLHKALKIILGKEVKQMGSNITQERLRFDFSFSRKLTEKEIKNIENLINKQIKRNLPVYYEEMPYEDAIKSGALSYFRDRYPAVVKVYTVKDFSKEICTGPHVENTKNLGKFKIVKEESSSSGIRRIKAILE
ncbi:MAG: alanine--tRNA ligase [Nanoarchaeota archaeon]|nr:alanine--tRNA ligase [Nanoarchaeota archaeon]